MGETRVYDVFLFSPDREMTSLKRKKTAVGNNSLFMVSLNSSLFFSEGHEPVTARLLQNTSLLAGCTVVPIFFCLPGQIYTALTFSLMRKGSPCKQTS